MLAEWCEMLIKIGSFRDAISRIVPIFHVDTAKIYFVALGTNHEVRGRAYPEESGWRAYA
jgi:hypothetical protein